MDFEISCLGRRTKLWRAMQDELTLPFPCTAACGAAQRGVWAEAKTVFPP